MHPLLERQLRRHFGAVSEVPDDLKPFLEAIDAAYEASDTDRTLMERSLDLASSELVERNAALEKENEEKEKAMKALQEGEEALREALERVQQMDAARASFINAAAHELGTPLTPLKLQLQVVKNRLERQPDEAQRRSVEILERNVERLTHLVSDLLDSAKLQSNRLETLEREIDLSTIVKGAVNTFQPLAEEVGVTLTIDANGFLPVWCDPNRIGQVIDNLLSNALKFTPKDGTVHVQLSHDDRYCKVEVTDSGRGISKEGLAKLFASFSQVHEGAHTANTGTGLGLYICKGLIERTGGRIWGASEGVGKGSTFAFTLPLNQHDER